MILAKSNIPAEKPRLPLYVFSSRLLSAGFATQPSLRQQSPAAHTGATSLAELAQCNIAAGTQTQPACRQPLNESSRAGQAEVQPHMQQEQWEDPNQRSAENVLLNTAISLAGIKAADDWSADSADAQLAPGGADAADVEFAVPVSPEMTTKGASMFPLNLNTTCNCMVLQSLQQGLPSLKVQGMQTLWLLLCLSHPEEHHCSLPLATRTARMHWPKQATSEQLL